MQPTNQITLNPDREYELVDGELEEKDVGGARHGGVVARLIIRLGSYVADHELGAVYGADTTYQVGRNERLPDVSFVSAERIPIEGEPEGKWLLAPDLAVEIVSPNDLYEKVIGKIEEYLSAGVRQVWLVSPEHRTITVYYSLTKLAVFTENDDLIIDDVIAGFQCSVSWLFRTPGRKSG